MILTGECSIGVVFFLIFNSSCSDVDVGVQGHKARMPWVAISDEASSGGRANKI